MKRKASFFVITSSLLLLLALFVSTGVAKSNGREDSPQACGPKFSLVPSENIRPSAENRLTSVATNGEQVVAVGFYRKPLSDLKSGLIEVWDGAKMRAKPVDLGGFENEMNWIAADHAGGFKVVGTIWEMTPKGRKSQIVVGRFDGQQFVREATIAIPGSVRNIPHRILVSGSTTWVDGYFTRKFGDPPTALKSSFVQMDRPYPVFRAGGKRPLAYVKPGESRAYPAYTKGDAETYPLLVQVQGSSWKRVRFPGEGWLDGMASRGSSHLVVIGMGNRLATAYEFQGTTWRSLEVPDWLKFPESYKPTSFSALLDVIATPRGFIFSRLQVNFAASGAHYAPSVHGGVDEMIEDGRFWPLGAQWPEVNPLTKVLIPALPGHQGVRYYGVNRLGQVKRTLLYPGYQDSDYPFRFSAQGIATTQTSVWVVGGLNESAGQWLTAVLRACPPLKVAGTEASPSTETP